MAARAALLDDPAHLGERGHGGAGLRRCRARHREQEGARERGEADHEQQRLGLPAVAQHQVQPDRRTRQRHAHQRQPREAVLGQHRVVVADHREQHRQREVGVVHAALLAVQAVDRVGRAALLLGAHQRLLTRDDHEEHVGGHDRAEHRAEVDERAAAREELAQAPCGERAQREEERGEHRLVGAQARSAQRVVDQPAADQEGRGNRDRSARGERGDRWIDQVDARAQPVHQYQHEHAGHPGAVGLPLEPVQRLGQLGRCDPELLRAVEAAAVHRPDLAGQVEARAFLAVARRVQVGVEPYEVERGADPGDAGDQVEPAAEEVQPLEDIGLHALSCRGRSTRPRARPATAHGSCRRPRRCRSR